MPNYISPPPQNPIARFIAAIVAVLAIAGAFMIGMVALLVVAGIGLLAGIAVWVRVAWFKHKLKKSGFNVNPANSEKVQQSEGHEGHIIDAEYTVVSEQEDKT